VRDAKTGPILVHVVTQKGKGYGPAENSADKYHGVRQVRRPRPAPRPRPSPTRRPIKKLFGESLIKEAAKDKRIIGITPRCRPETGIDLFQKAFPDRTFDVGIAEQHAVNLRGRARHRGHEAVLRHLFDLPAARLRPSGARTSRSRSCRCASPWTAPAWSGADGPTHAGSFDIAYLGCLPGFVLMAAGDEADLVHMVATQVALDDCPSALRYPRGEGVGVTMPEEGKPLEIGKGRILKEGHKIALLSYGTRLAES